ncbi:hypothetical protein LTR70_004790 [Exophiala xenobiotica]|uniref:Uncharacterized protein n=1 Tax=Lithohypha guttulata TaxID=1690604 RepID=A0ABR0KCE5_9EURO|nr:hypothetical protein LTR24_004282 [Lithohypha guttulata]KAK5319880.1 hypothetical protein LTR70_004790 [Exophiala xenobiotica]
MASEPRNILGMGLKIASQNIDPAGTMISNEISKATAANYHLDVFEVDLSLPHDEIISGLTQHLKSKAYAAISIGFGVRGNKDLTPLFEILVNTCIEYQPKAKLGFALWPTQMVEACERVLY